MSRSLAWLLLAVLGAWFGIGRADAADCRSASDHCSIAEAVASCNASAGMMDVPAWCEHSPSSSTSGQFSCKVDWSGTYTCGYYGSNFAQPPIYGAGNTFFYDKGCPVGSVWNEDAQSCVTDCSAQQPFIGAEWSVPNGTLTCNVGSLGANDCYYSVHHLGDGTSQYTPIGTSCPDGFEDRKDECEALDGYYWNAGMIACIPIEPEECEPGQDGTDGTCTPPEKCPAGMVEDANGWCKPESNECPAGQVKAPDGSCVDDENACPTGTAKGGDGTCKPDADGDGEPDEEGDGENKFSGGDDCKTPPQCSGDAILCGQAKIQWRIDCNTRRNTNIEGGACEAMPICTGESCDAMEYAQLIQQWRTSCALQSLELGGGGQGNGDLIDYMTGVRQAESDALADSIAEGDGLDGVDESGIFHEFSNDDFNPNLFGGQTGGTCSFTTELSLVGHPIELPPEFWTLAGWIGWLIVAAAYLWVAQQLGG